MSADSFFFKGYGHDVCQDFAYAKNNLVIVSDGCSSSLDTDFGARLLVKITENVLLKSYNAKAWHVLAPISEFEQIIISKIKETKEILNLKDGVFDATLLFATPEIQYCYGDGVIAYIKNNEIIIYNISYPSGAPLYLNYSTNIPRKEGFIGEFGLQRDVEITLMDKITGEIKQKSKFSDNNFSPYIINNVDADVIILMSDGVNTFDFDDAAHDESIDTDVIIHNLLSFKSFNGQFVTRRVKSFMKKCKDLHWENFDDVSVAALARH